MRVQIRTVYNSENCGSFWQAFALCEVVEALGHEAFFLTRPTRDSSHGLDALARKTAHAFFRQRSIRRAVSAVRTHARFSRAQKVFDVSDGQRPYDAVLLGSDTIWQCGSPHFDAHFDRYWARDVDGGKKRIVAYAPSIAGSDSSQYVGSADVRRALDGMHEIAVRDRRSQAVLEQCTDKPISIVCDPTLLLGRDCYEAMASAPRGEEYLFVYYFGEPPDDLAEAALGYAADRTLKIVSYFGTKLTTRDAPSAIDPFEFLGLMGNASLVLTNTFHGTLFSQIFGKDTVFDSTGRSKVVDVISRLGLERHDYANSGDIASLFGCKIDRATVDDRITDARLESLAYLDRALS